MFQLNASSSSSDAEDDDAPLPFPAALPRSDFLARDFHAPSYLSSLPHRHQTLEDLRADLRDRSSAISAELLDLVNSNYTAFLSLGNDLRGGDNEVEDVKVAMLGFRRAIDEIKVRVRSRGMEVKGLSEELGVVRKEVEIGRLLLEIDQRLSALETRLALRNDSSTIRDRPWVGDDSEDDEADEDGEDHIDGLLASSPRKLATLSREYMHIERLATFVGREKPLIAKMDPRMQQCRNTILLDLSNALKEARRAGPKAHPRTVKFLRIYSGLGCEADAIDALKSK